MPDPKPRDVLELELLERLRANDVQAFEALFRAYAEPLSAFAYSYVRSQAAAQEIVQDLFCRLWERRHTLGMPRSVHAYLYGAVRNRAINQLRNRRAEEAFLARARERATVRQQASAASLIDQQQELETTELAAAVERAVAEMPGRCREVFTLTRDRGFTYTEVAVVLQISPKTVETHMGRALAFLRRRLGPWLTR